MPNSLKGAAGLAGGFAKIINHIKKIFEPETLP
jgi:hypothetical protein